MTGVDQLEPFNQVMGPTPPLAEEGDLDEPHDSQQSQPIEPVDPEMGGAPAPVIQVQLAAEDLDPTSEGWENLQAFAPGKLSTWPASLVPRKRKYNRRRKMKRSCMKKSHRRQTI